MSLRKELDEFYPEVLERASKGKCDGSCDEHIGDVFPVRVFDRDFDWGWFSYCEAARKEDARRGMTLLMGSTNSAREAK